MDRLHRERRQKPLKRTPFNLNELIFIISLKVRPVLNVISLFFVSLFVTLENAAKFTKLSARTYGELVSAQLVYVNDSLITLCFALDEICLRLSVGLKSQLYTLDLRIIQRLILKWSD